MSHKRKYFDAIIIGSGIVGLAHANHLAKAGKSIALFERHPKALGASIRNFGMIWPIGQAEYTLERALRSRSIWLELAKAANFWAAESGSLHLAYHDDEINVLKEFYETTKHLDYDCQLLKPKEALRKSKAIKRDNFKMALWSSTEVNIDPRQAIEQLHHYLSEEFDVTFFYNTAITTVDFPYVSDGVQQWKAEEIFICSGSDFETLFPHQFKAAPLIKCKLQMMRTSSQKDWALGPNLAGGLTLQHYSSFAHCNTLSELQQRFSEEMADYNKYGIHVLVSQTAKGEITIGDSHEYGSDISPFSKTIIDRLILQYFHKMVQIPRFDIKETWTGIYPKLTTGGTEWIIQPQEGVTIINGLGGAGMTLSFGLAEEVVHDKYHGIKKTYLPQANPQGERMREEER